MEGLCVSYDNTVRNTDGSVVQFFYGEDGLDHCHTKFMEAKQFRFFASNARAVAERYHAESTLLSSNQPKCEGDNHMHNSERRQRRMFKKVKRYKTKQSEKFDAKDDLSQPIMGGDMALFFNPANIPGVVSEKFDTSLQSYINANTDGLLSPALLMSTAQQHSDYILDTDSFQELMYMKYLKSLAQPGEAVGMFLLTRPLNTVDYYCCYLHCRCSCLAVDWRAFYSDDPQHFPFGR